MTPEQVMLVRNSFARIAPYGDEAGTIFYIRLFSIDPMLRHIFHGDIADQAPRFIGMLKIIVGNLDNLELMIPAIQHLGRRHGAYGVQDKHYATLRQALLEMLHQGLGEQYTPEVEAAWSAAYEQVISIMKQAAESLVETHRAH